jgi:hypothetical protein
MSGGVAGWLAGWLAGGRRRFLCSRNSFLLGPAAAQSHLKVTSCTLTNLACNNDVRRNV